MTRKAIIIGAPGNNLNGVKFDVENYTTFLMSPSGGAWARYEIMDMINPTKKDLLKRIADIEDIDYVLVIFSGHGAWEKGTDRQIIKINDTQKMYLDDLITSAPKQLFIVDACRSLVEGLSGFDNGGVFMNFPSNLSIKDARQAFDNHLRKCKDGVMICTSCEIKKTSADGDDGSFFSNSLLKRAKEWTKLVCLDARIPILPIR